MPIHNIFKKLKSRKRKTKSVKTPLIIADTHERNSLIISELHSSKQVRLEIKSLKIGDYLIGNTIIERKTVQDFISSMINKRLIQQLNQMKKYKQQLILIEGDLEKINDFKTPNAIRGFILSIITNYQIPIIFTQDYKDTSKYLITLAKQQLKKSITPSFHSRIPKKIKEQKQYVLESFPNIGPITAKKLLKKFKTISNTINASEEDLKEVLKSRTPPFKNLIDS
jgi:Fanconi anemia group M protein